MEVVPRRFIITEPDEKVLLDTAAWTGAGPFLRLSTFANWQAGTISPYRKYNSFVGFTQAYVAHRLGPYLNSTGTAVLSINN